ncbi:MAG: YdcF family protein [Gammaproteobacteria bacterium]
MEILIVKLAKALVLPPGINIVMLVLGIALWARHPAMAKSLVVIGALTLWLLSTPVFMSWLTRPLESTPPLSISETRNLVPEAIVVLGGGRRTAPAYGAQTVSTRALERVRYAARLKRATGLPLAVVGGSVSGEGVPEAVLMKEVLEDEFNVQVDFTEGTSRNTAQNALNASRLPIARKILLVTDAAHMPRARQAFQSTGFIVTPAPVHFRTTGVSHRRAFDWVPSVRALSISRDTLHEYLGLIWYRLRYGFG